MRSVSTSLGSLKGRSSRICWRRSEIRIRSAVFGCKMIDSMEGELVEAEIIHVKWLVWQGKGSKASERIKALDGRFLLREGYEFKTHLGHRQHRSPWPGAGGPQSHLVRHRLHYRKLQALADVLPQSVADSSCHRGALLHAKL